MTPVCCCQLCPAKEGQGPCRHLDKNNQICQGPRLPPNLRGLPPMTCRAHCDHQWATWQVVLCPWPGLPLCPKLFIWSQVEASLPGTRYSHGKRQMAMVKTAEHHTLSSCSNVTETHRRSHSQQDNGRRSCRSQASQRGVDHVTGLGASGHISQWHFSRKRQPLES